MSTINAKLHLLKLNCYQSDETKADEVFIKWNGRKIWPAERKYLEMSDEVVKIGLTLEIDLGSQVLLELWDYDLISANDKLGEFKMMVDQKGGSFTTDLVSGSGRAKYSLEWEVS